MISRQFEPPTPSARWPARALLILVLLGVLLRGGLIARALYPPGSHLDDPDNYVPLARALAQGAGLALEGRPTAYRPPLYPLILAPIVGTLGAGADWGIAILHLGFGAATILLTAAAARSWKLSRRRVLVAAAIVAFDPVLASQARAVMTETLAALLTAATLVAVSRPGPGGLAPSGLAMGCAVLCRPSAWPGVLLTAAARLLHDRTETNPVGSTLRAAGLLLGTLALTVSPWVARNALVLGEPIMTTTHGGYTLALANNPTYYREVVDGPPGAVWTGPNQWLWWDSVNRTYAGLSEPEADRQIGRAALEFVRQHPGTFARASLQRLGRFWGLAPAAAVYPAWLRVASIAWTAPLWIALAAALGDCRSWRWPRISAILLILGLTCVHLIYWTDLRMRAPIVPAIALVAASALEPGGSGRIFGRFGRIGPASHAEKNRKILSDSTVQISSRR